MALNINGRMKVKTLKTQFKDDLDWLLESIMIKVLKEEGR